MAKKRRRRGKIVIKERAKIVHKGDSISKDSIGKDSIPKAPAKVYPENSVNFKVKIRKK